MELKVWVEGIQRIVCGVTDKTTCQDVVYALAHATGKTGRFTLIERWRHNERLLAPQEHPLKVLQKWGEYSQDVQFILQRSSLDCGNRGHLSPQLQRVFGPQNSKGRPAEPPSAVWKAPPPPEAAQHTASSASVTGAAAMVRSAVNGVTNARLSPDSGRGSDKTGSDTSNSEKEKQPANLMNGLPPPGRSASASQIPFQNPYWKNSQNWSNESPYGYFKQQSVPNLRQNHPMAAGALPNYKQPSSGSASQRNSSPADPPPYREPPPPGSVKYRPPHYSPPPTHKTPHLSRHPSRSSLAGNHAPRYQHHQPPDGLPHRQQQRPAYQGGHPTEIADLIGLVSAQQSTLQSQHVEIRQCENEVAYLESLGSGALPSSINHGPAPSTALLSKDYGQLEMVLNEVRRLEDTAIRNDEELQQMSMEHQQRQLLSPTECEDKEIRNEICQLKQRLAGTDQELQRTNHTLRRLGDEMRNMSIEKSRQKEQELLQEMDRLQLEIKAMQKSSEDSANISQQLNKEVKEVEEQISQRKAEVEKLIQEMREANMESLAISPPEESKQFLDGPSKPGVARKMMGSPRQLESAVPTSKNPHGVWV